MNRHDVAKDIINEYISSSTQLADPEPTKPLLVNGNQSNDSSEEDNDSWTKELQKKESKPEPVSSLPPARRA